MTDLTSEFIRQSVYKTYSENKEYIISRLGHAVSEDEPHALQTNKIISNSMLVSSEISCLILLKILEDIGLLKEQELHERPSLSLVWDSSKRQHEDNQ